MALDDILLEAEEKMIKSTEVIQAEFGGIRTGKASPDLVTNIMVEAYGTNMRLRELAAVTTPVPGPSSRIGPSAFAGICAAMARDSPGPDGATAPVVTGFAIRRPRKRSVSDMMLQRG